MLKGKSYICTYTKSILGHALTVMINSEEFFLFTVVFLQHFALFSFLCFSSLPLLWILFRVIYYGFCTIFSIHVWVRCWEFPCPILPLLEPSTLSCKTACLLFMHHLHINAARELAGQHLMWRWQYFQIFVIHHPYPLSGICPSPCRKVPLIRCIKGLRRFPAISDRGSGIVIILGQG